MACDDWTPFTISNYPYTVNRIRVTAGGATNQSTGEWTAETTSSVAVVGYLGIGDLKLRMTIETIENMMGGKFQTGDLYFACHCDCDIAVEDILEVYDDTDGDTKSYWRIVAWNKMLTEAKKLTPWGRNYFLVRREER